MADQTSTENLEDRSGAKGRKPISLRSALLTSIVGLQLITVFAIFLLVFWVMDRAITQQSKELLEKRSEATVERINNFFLPSQQVNEMLVKIVESGMTDLAQNNVFERMFFGALQTSPQIPGLYFGRPDGSYIYVYREDHSSRFITKWIDEPGGGATFLIRDKGYTPVSRYIDRSDPYDPRLRTWYISAKNAEHSIWTNPYTFYTSGRNGVTQASPVYRSGDFLGVFGTDIEISKLGGILEESRQGEALNATILTERGQVIVSVQNGEVAEYPSLAALSEVDGGMTRRIFERYRSSGGKVATIQTKLNARQSGEQVFARVQPLMQQGLPWILLTHGSKQSLAGSLTANQTRLVWVAGLVLVSITLCAIPLAEFIRRPFLDFAEQSRSMVDAPSDVDPAFDAPYSELETTGKTLADEIFKRRNVELQYDRTFDVSQRGMARIDPLSMRFLHVNKRFCEMLGRSKEDLLSCGFDTVLSAEPQKTLVRFRDSVMRDRDFTIETGFVGNGDRSIPLRMTAFLMRDLDGHPDHAFAVFDNNEESKLSAARLENFKRDVDRIGRINLMGQFAAGLAHELNQPLGALVHDVDSARFVMAETKADQAELSEILQDIEGHALRAGEIIRALRNMIEVDDQVARTFQFNDLVEQTLAIMGPEAAAYDVDIETDIPECYVIFGNSVQIAQVLVNLFRNAISALSRIEVRDRKVRLEAYLCAETIVVVVEDNGPGFPPYIRPFAQFETTSRTGLGLGLSISKSLVEANKGTIIYKDRDVCGARFEITLPGKCTQGEHEHGADGKTSDFYS